jgi:TM2 domain-containing membrane protein YozV/uncharacterized membrane protein YciS (DUF1049 family)
LSAYPVPAPVQTQSNLTSLAKLILRITLVLGILGEVVSDVALGYFIARGTYQPSTGGWAIIAVGFLGLLIMAGGLLLSKKLSIVAVALAGFGVFLSSCVSYYAMSIIDQWFSFDVVVNHLPGKSLYDAFVWAADTSADWEPMAWVNFFGWGLFTPLAAILIWPALIVSLIAIAKKPSATLPMATSPMNFDPNTGLPLNNNTGEQNMTYNNFGGFQQPSAEAIWVIMIPGYGEQPLNVFQLRQMAVAGHIKGETPIKDSKTGNVFMAKQVPGIFSQRDYVTMLLISWFLGVFGVDRFMLGQTGLGIAKLLTAGGCGVWALIDFILIAMRKVTDSEGLPLA